MAQDLGTARKIKRPAHARLGPSGAHRWLYCAGSVNAEKGLDDTAGRPAAEGTAFHEWAAECAEFGLEPEDLYGSTMHVPGAWKTDRHGLPYRTDGFDFTMDDEFGRHMVAGLARIRELAEPHGVLLFVETVVDTSRWLGPDQFGTADIIIVDLRLREITIFDWKYGRGVPVGAANNSQLKLYALGVLAFLDARGIEYGATWTVRTIIEQPRHVKGGGEWTTTVGQLLAFGEWARERAAATNDPDAPRTPGPEQCEFCKAKGRCAELADYLYETVQTKFDEEAAEMGLDQPIPAVAELSVEHRIAIWRNAPLFEKFFKAVHASLMLDWSHGEKPPGLKMVAGRKGRREYDPGAMPAIEKTLVDALAAEAWQDPKLISPAQAEKKLGKKAYADTLARFVRQGEGKPALVEANDERPALETVDEKFADDDEDEFFD